MKLKWLYVFSLCEYKALENVYQKIFKYSRYLKFSTKILGKSGNLFIRFEQVSWLSRKITAKLWPTEIISQPVVADTRDTQFTYRSNYYVIKLIRAPRDYNGRYRSFPLHPRFGHKADSVIKNASLTGVASLV